MKRSITFSHRIEYFFTRAAAFTVQILPLRAALFFGACLGRTAWFFGVRRKVAGINIKTAFPEISMKEADRIGRASYANSGRFMAEFIRQGRMGREYFDKYITLEKTPALEKLMSYCGGVMALGFHLL